MPFAVHTLFPWCFLLFFVTMSAAQESAPKPQAEQPVTTPVAVEPAIIPRSHQFSLRSRDGTREYRIQVAEPKSGPPKSGYPVVYALDGNAVFGTFAETARVQRRGVLIVGIGYPSDAPFDAAREYDFTPLRTTKDDDSDSAPKTGGQEEFLSFIQEVLKPAIEQRFKVNRSRQTLFGHSLGGLFVLHVLYTRPDTFHTYAAGSPSMWWNDQAILAEERAFFEKKGAKADLFLFIGDRDARHMVHDATRLSERLTPLTAYGTRVYFQVFESEDHVSVLPAAISRAFRLAADN
ncbi:MAG TPA: alpha/beta hydrolase-fold protein [Pirellulales bacterium]|jgi:hypothetical protein